MLPFRCLILQPFLQPTTSSFKKPITGQPEKTLILQPEHLGACALLYACSAPLIFVLCTWCVQAAFSIITLVRTRSVWPDGHMLASVLFGSSLYLFGGNGLDSNICSVI